jgi:hypothetical protein
MNIRMTSQISAVRPPSDAIRPRSTAARWSAVAVARQPQDHVVAE